MPPGAARLQTEVAHQGHAGIDAFWFARVDAVVVEEHQPPGQTQLFAIKHRVGCDYPAMDGYTIIGDTDAPELQQRREFGRQLFVKRNALPSGRGLITVAGLERGLVLHAQSVLCGRTLKWSFRREWYRQSFGSQRERPPHTPVGRPACRPPDPHG